jgi:hypothetical protein
MKAGVIDPAKVTRSTLQNASSIAALLLTTEALVAEQKEDEKVPGLRGPSRLSTITSFWLLASGFWPLDFWTSGLLVGG